MPFVSAGESRFSSVDCSSCESKYAAFHEPSTFSNLEPVCIFLRQNVAIDAGEVQRRTREASDYMTSVNREISHLLDMIAVLEQRRCEAATYQTYCSSSLAPVRRLPAEILAEVFRIAVRQQGAASIEYDEGLRKCHMSITQSVVCSFWRQVCLNEPSLWSNLSINFCQVREDSLEQSPVLAHYLDLSKQIPLTLDLSMSSISLDNEDGATEFQRNIVADQQQMLRLLCDQDYRWTKFRGYDVDESRFTKSRGYLPLLRTLSLFHGSDVAWFDDAPCLKAVVLSGMILDHSLSWQNVERLELIQSSDIGKVTWYHQLRLVQESMPNIRSLRTQMVHSYRANIQARVQNPIVFSSLESLTVHDKYTYGQITAPRLGHLGVSIAEGIMDSQVEEGPQFLLRSGAAAKINSITLDSTDMMPPELIIPNFLPLFRLTCNVTTLTVNFLPFRSFQELCDTLTVKASEQCIVLLPCLSHLRILESISPRECLYEIRDKFLEMLKSRWAATVPNCLRTVSMDCTDWTQSYKVPIASPNRYVTNRFRRLREGGLATYFNGESELSSYEQGSRVANNEA